MSQQLVMYIVVNKDLRMGAGKAASQCCHAVAGVLRRLEQGRHYRQWLRQGEAKVVLKATAAQLQELLDQTAWMKELDVVCCTVYDEGRTQVEAGSLTAVAFSPLGKQQAPDLLRSLPLL